MQEYTKHELAEDEEDEKRIFKARLRAERKMKVERVQRARLVRRTRPYPTDPDKPHEPAPERPNKSARVDGNNKPGTCYKCGFLGHWAGDCSGEAQTKISNLQDKFK